MYCEKCCRLFEEKASVCPFCGSRKIRQPWADDQCYLTEKTSPWGEMLAEVLAKNAVSFLQKPVLGAGMTLSLGQGTERYRFYVVHAQLDRARDILDTLFPEEQ